LYVGVTFFVVFGAQDQLSVWSFVELPIDASSLAFITALAFTFYLLFLDVHTRKLLIEAKPWDLAKRGWRWVLDRREKFRTSRAG
jgi:alpha-1,6-mannosyltransferase